MEKPATHDLIEIARGDRPADLLIRNARLINVYLGEVVDTDIAIAKGYVVGFGSYQAKETVDLKRCFVAPGFIDAHVHIESAMIGPAEFARTVLPHGTSAVVADPHEIANVLGTVGIDYMLRAGQDQLISFFFTLPSCVPASPLESAGAELSAEDLESFINHPRVVGLAEMMNFPGIINADPKVLAKLNMAARSEKRIDGHAPGLSDRYLNAYLASGISSDHECTTIAEAREKLAGGMHIMVREGTGARNLDDLLQAVTPGTGRRMMWCTDDRHPQDLMDTGHIDSMVRHSVKKGLDPVIAIQMATLNPAEYFGLKEFGGIAPGRRADIVVFEDLRDPIIKQVYNGGRLMAEEGRLISDKGEQPRPDATDLPGAMNIDTRNLDLSVSAAGRNIRILEVVPDQIVTRSAVQAALIKEDRVVSDTARDLLKIVVLERHKGSGRRGIGFIRGFGLRYGALASTVTHDSHNIIAVGVDDADLLHAIQTVGDMGGGLAAVHQDRILARLPLPIAGLMSNESIDRVRRNLDDLIAAAAKLGTALPDPFMTLSFMALPVIPELKITDLGLVDVGRFEIVPLFVD